MKKFIIISILVSLFAAGTTLMAQNQQEEYLGLPGDNLNLYAVMKLFQESQTLEGFERSLNDENSRINNLDLNGDNMVDYIMVVDYVDGDVHTIVLRVAVNQRENQDVAVFTVQRYSNGQVQIQLTGDESLYGRNYIIEPIYDDGNPGQTPNPGYTGRVYGSNFPVVRTTAFEIAAWPLVRFIFLPSYHIWHSSWHWGFYPTYWNPWRPYYYHYYYGYHYNLYNDYYGHYRRWNNHRYSHWNDFYYSRKRSYSPNVSRRIQAGNYRDTYSRPDQRRDGEAMYAKIYPSGTRRQSDNSSGNRPSIRSGSQSNQGRESIGNRNNTTIRSANTATNRSVTNSRPEQNVSTTRRSTTTVNNRSVTNSRPEQNVSTTRRSTTTVNNRSVTNSRPEQNVSTTRRSTTTVNNRSVTNSRPEQSAGTNRTSRQSTTGVSSSNRRSSESSKSGTTAKQSGKTKQSEVESKKDTRRR